MSKYNQQPTLDPKKAFAGIGDAQVSQGRRYFTQGKYRVKIDTCTLGTTRAGDDFFATEMEVIECNNEDFRPGDQVSWFVKLSNDSALGNIKGFIAAALNTDADDITSEDPTEAVGDDQPLQGVIVDALATDIVTRKGNDFTVVDFFAVE